MMNDNYDNLIIYYFSGTGNAKRAAGWMIDEAKLGGLNTIIYNIEEKTVDFPDNLEGRTLIGIVSPTHGFNMPPIMLKFIFKFPKIANSDIFISNTRAGMKLHKLFVGGISGIALMLSALIFILKGYKIKALKPIDLPSNWISLHPGLRKKVVDSMFVHYEKVSRKLIRRLSDGKCNFAGLRMFPLDLFIAPIAIMYYIFGRFGLAKTFIANYNCTNCGACIKQCPVQAIRYVQNRPYWSVSCESCMRCMNNCKFRAIETAHGYTIVLWWVVFSFIPAITVYIVINYLHIENEFLLSVFSWLTMTGIGLPIIFGSYKVLHFLLGFKALNKLFTYTSFTRYRFWRRYKLPK